MESMLRRKTLTGNAGVILLCFISWVCATEGVYGQAPAGSTSAQSHTQSRPAFEVATIKPMNPDFSGHIGFESFPGGRISVGHASLQTLISLAFDVQEFQAVGEPHWADSVRYDIVALPPDTSKSRTVEQPPVKATPSEEQRKMLQTLLEDRFGLKCHREFRQGPVYILSRGSKTLMLQETKYKDADPRASVGYDGAALAFNVTMKVLANEWGPWLERPVLDQTGLTGSYDYRLMPYDPSNHDMAVATIGALNRLGLKLKAGKAPIETIVIDSAHLPSEN